MHLTLNSMHQQQKNQCGTYGDMASAGFTGTLFIILGYPCDCHHPRGNNLQA